MTEEGGGGGPWLMTMPVATPEQPAPSPGVTWSVPSFALLCFLGSNNRQTLTSQFTSTCTPDHVGVGLEKVIGLHRSADSHPISVSLDLSAYVHGCMCRRIFLRRPIPMSVIFRHSYPHGPLQDQCLSACVVIGCFHRGTIPGQEG